MQHKKTKNKELLPTCSQVSNPTRLIPPFTFSSLSLLSSLPKLGISYTPGVGTLFK